MAAKVGSVCLTACGGNTTIKRMENELARLEGLLEQLIERHQADRDSLKALREQLAELETARQEEVAALQSEMEKKVSALEDQLREQMGALKAERNEQVGALEAANRELQDKVRFASERLEALLEKMPEA